MPPSLAIEFEDVCFSYLAGARVLEPFDLAIEPGGLYFVKGESGAGETTLVKLMLGALEPDFGEVRCFGQKIAGLKSGDLYRFRRRMRAISQNPRVIEDLTVFGNVSLPLVLADSLPQESIRARVFWAMQIAGIDSKARVKLRNLSGGERQRVAVAQSIVDRPLVLVADEPTAKLDPVSAQELAGGIKAVCADHFSVTLRAG